ncbi:MAG TPA: PAS domain S-box protein [Pyrinomonadaceae bacterium]|jgi:two-component system sensor histidine kinase UhpB|nr:PAS domain S-box protein [Pyrinomonadaceae bacterium]
MASVLSERGLSGENLKRLLAREQIMRRETEILRDANIALTQNLSLDTILETFLDYLIKLVPYDSANVMLRDGDSKFVVAALRRYEGFQDVATTRAIALDGSANPLLNRICLTKQSLLVPDTNKEPEWQRVPGAEHVRNWLGVPLIASGKVIGLYSVDKAQPGFFNAEHGRLAETLAARAASAIQNAQLFQQSQHHVEELEELITERNQAGTALRESEERYRELFENAKDAIYVHDLKGTYTSINRASELLSGYARQEIIGRNFADFIAPENLAEVRENLCTKLATKGETNYEVDVIRKDGQPVPVEISSRSIYENGVMVGVQGTVRDITERKRAQEALQMFSRQLIETQEQERRRIALELHDQIGQVLTVVKMNLTSVQRACPAPEAAPYIKDNMDLVDEALRLVRDLSIDLRPLLLDDLGLVAALRWYLDRYAQRTGVKADFHVELPKNADRVSHEIETACFRIVQEALTNIGRHAQAEYVSIQLTGDKRELFLRVKDDGIGFDPNLLRTRAMRDATLGLLGMQERAHAAGGTIEIDSAPSKGTEIRLRFPTSQSSLEPLRG